MDYFFKKKNILILFFVSVILLFFYFDLDSFFTIDYLKKNNEFLENYVENNFLLSLIIFHLAFLILLFFFLPIVAIMFVASGFFFTPTISLAFAIILTIITISLGGFLNFLILEKFQFNSIFDKASFFATKLKDKIRSNEIQYLLILRLIPLPFVIQNAITVVLKVSKRNFFITTLFGVSPYATIYSFAGYKLKKIINQNDLITLKDLLNVESFFIVFLLFILIFISLFFKKKFL